MDVVDPSTGKHGWSRWRSSPPRSLGHYALKASTTPPRAQVQSSPELQIQKEILGARYRSGTGDEKARSLVLLLTGSSTGRGPLLKAHEPGSFGRQHEQGRSTNFQRSSK
ncbi:unnamed protein product [Triticum turgidum subsp. durum]|nr:unnamed protein product [Triticum turgidum subsp. durum]